VWDILEAGSKKAVEVTSETLAVVREAMKLP
jgi:hypothetical protein